MEGRSPQVKSDPGSGGEGYGVSERVGEVSGQQRVFCQRGVISKSKNITRCLLCNNRLGEWTHKQRSTTGHFLYA